MSRPFIYITEHSFCFQWFNLSFREFHSKQVMNDLRLYSNYLEIGSVVSKCLTSFIKYSLEHLNVYARYKKIK